MTMTTFDTRLLFLHSLRRLSHRFTCSISRIDSPISFLAVAVFQRAFVNSVTRRSPIWAQEFIQFDIGMKSSQNRQQKRLSHRDPFYRDNPSCATFRFGSAKFLKLRSSIILRFFVSRSHRPGRRNCLNRRFNEHKPPCPFRLCACLCLLIPRRNSMFVSPAQSAKDNAICALCSSVLRSLLRVSIACC